MNHTIKGILIVVAIASMLVVGATNMFPIMQNSFASKKSDFKGADRDPNTNTNTNTNSADSTSSSTATADNTNNINNKATASQSQEQSACAVALTCPEGSTTVTITPPPPPTTGTLRVTKICSPDCTGTEFTISVQSENSPDAIFTLQSGQTQTVTLNPSKYGMSETTPSGFGTPDFTADCGGTISAGQTLHCTITNHPTT